MSKRDLETLTLTLWFTGPPIMLLLLVAAAAYIHSQK